MQEINFLPPEYHEAAVKRQGKLWHLIVVAMFGGVVIVATLMQVSARRHVEAQLAEVEPQFLAATQATADLARLQDELKQAAASAQLCVYLEGRWPITQVLTSAVGSVPESVRLTQLNYSRQNLAEQAGHSGPRPPALRGDAARQTEEANASLLEAQRDLATLRDGEKGMQTVVILEGLSADSSELHAYTSQLARHPLLAKAELLSLEGSQQEGSTFSTFRLRLVIQPIGARPPMHTATAAENATVSLTERRP